MAWRRRFAGNYGWSVRGARGPAGILIMILIKTSQVNSSQIKSSQIKSSQIKSDLIWLAPARDS